MPILEMEKLKKAYPQYKDIPDERLLTHVAKAYPQYAGIAEREFGEIKKTPPIQEQIVGAVKHAIPKVVEDVKTGARKALEYMGEPVPSPFEWEQGVPIHKDLPVGHIPRWEAATKNVALLSILAYTGKDIIQAAMAHPRTQYTLSRIASAPSIEKADKGTLFRMAQKLTATGQPLTGEEKVLYSKIGKDMSKVGEILKSGKIELAKPRPGFGWLYDIMGYKAPGVVAPVTKPEEVGKKALVRIHEMLKPEVKPVQPVISKIEKAKVPAVKPEPIIGPKLTEPVKPPAPIIPEATPPRVDNVKPIGITTPKPDKPTRVELRRPPKKKILYVELQTLKGATIQPCMRKT